LRRRRRLCQDSTGGQRCRDRRLSCSLRLRSNVLDLDCSTLSIARCLGFGLGDRSILVAKTANNGNLTGFGWLSN
ncbi:hypothetical protein KCU59_g159, partial [Aureobasidium melanogenum]